MTIISTREFRANQGTYLDLAAGGQQVVIKSRQYGSFRLMPVSEDDTLMSKEELEARIKNGLDQIARGECIEQAEGESIDDFLKRIL